MELWHTALLRFCSRHATALCTTAWFSPSAGRSVRAGSGLCPGQRCLDPEWPLYHIPGLDSAGKNQTGWDLIEKKWIIIYYHDSATEGFLPFKDNFEDLKLYLKRMHCEICHFGIHLVHWVNFLPSDSWAAHYTSPQNPSQSKRRPGLLPAHPWSCFPPLRSSVVGHGTHNSGVGNVLRWRGGSIFTRRSPVRLHGRPAAAPRRSRPSQRWRCRRSCSARAWPSAWTCSWHSERETQRGFL